MRMQKAYYLTTLYPFQDGIISLMKDLGTAFYLTGGTALSRGYYNHRFSDDLDFFVNNDSDYLSYVKKFLKKIVGSDMYEISHNLNYQINDDFSRFFLERTDKSDEAVLKVDFINDIDLYYGEIINDEKFGKLDNVKNILINKITALTRFEPKDIADIWIIAKNLNFNWKEILNKVKNKDAGVTEEEASGIIINFPEDFFERIRWNIKVDKKTFRTDISVISKELLNGKENSLSK